MKQDSSHLTAKDHSINAAQAIIKGIPYIGGSLEQFIFGPLDELRMRRIEDTLREIAEKLETKGRSPKVDTEEFVNLLESVIPQLSRAVHEDRRQRFRDLLLNAATVPAGSSEWEEATTASRLLEEIDTPGLAILAALAKCRKTDSLTLTSKPVPQVYEGEFDYDKPDGPQHAIPYSWTVVEEWVLRLREKRLIAMKSSDARGGFNGVAVTGLGQLLIRWILADEDSAT